MPDRFFPHATLPSSWSLASGSVEESVRPNLRRAYPVEATPEDGARFYRVLEALRRRTMRDEDISAH